MPAPPTRLDTADSAAEHTAWARLRGMSPRECARAIGWTVSDGVSWGLVTALYAAEAGKLVDTGGKQRCHETVKAGALDALRPTAIGDLPVVSTAVSAAADVIKHRVKDRSPMPNRQDHELTFVARNGLGRGAHRSERRSM